MRIRLACIAAAAAALPSFAPAGEAGAVDVSLCFEGTRHLITATSNDRFGSFVVKGRTESANKLFDGLTFECTGAFELRQSGYLHKDYCVYQDANGDKMSTIDFESPQIYAWEYLGGTGRFQGITGNGTTQRVGETRQIGSNGFGACRHLTGSYALP